MTSQTSTTHFFYTRAMEALLVENKFTADDGWPNDFDGISSVQNAWDYMSSPMVDGLFPTDLYGAHILLTSAAFVFGLLGGALVLQYRPLDRLLVCRIRLLMITHQRRYNGDPSNGNVLEDSKLLGVPRLRMVKVANDSCIDDIPEQFSETVNLCYARYVHVFW
jgi:hypothetical protein